MLPVTLMIITVDSEETLLHLEKSRALIQLMFDERMWKCDYALAHIRICFKDNVVLS